jgi:hypothetical protein
MSISFHSDCQTSAFSQGVSLGLRLATQVITQDTRCRLKSESGCVLAVTLVPGNGSVPFENGNVSFGNVKMSLWNAPYHSRMVTQVLENPRGRMCAGRQRGLAGPRASWQGSSILLVGVSTQWRCSTAGSDCSLGCQTSAFSQGVRRATLVITQDTCGRPKSGSVLAAILVPLVTPLATRRKGCLGLAIMKHSIMVSVIPE